jgi:hypothetical protein
LNEHIKKEKVEKVMRARRKSGKEFEGDEEKVIENNDMMKEKIQ